MTDQGVVLTVDRNPVRSGTVAEALTGADELAVTAAFPFDVLGGQLRLDWETETGEETTTLDYTTIDLTLHTIQLAVPLVEDIPVEAIVTPLPEAFTMTATVDTDAEIEPGEFAIDHALQLTNALSVGDYTDGGGARVLIENVAGTPTITRVLGGPPAVLSDDAATGVVPGHPSEIPSAAPDVEARAFAIGAIELDWDEVPDAEWYNVYGSTTTGFDSDDPANFLQSVTEGHAIVSSIDGVQIPVNGDLTYFVVKGANALGEGPPSLEVSAAARQADAEFISALMGYFGTIEAQAAILGTLNVVMTVDVDGSIRVGDRITIADPNAPDGKGGIIIWGDDAHTIIKAKFHPDGNYLDGILVAQEITVIQALRLIGTASAIASGAKVKLENGVADPPAPVITSGGIQRNWPAIPAGYVEKGICWDATGTRWWQLLWRTSNSRAYVREISTGGVASSVILLDPDWAADETLTLCNSICFAGGSLYVFQRYSIANTFPSKYWRISRYTTAGVGQSGNAAHVWDESPTVVAPVVGTDGTYIFWTEPSTGAASAMDIGRCALNLAGGSVFRDIDVTPIPDDGREAKALMVGSFDLGTPLLQLTDINGYSRHFTVAADPWTGQAMAPQVQHDFRYDPGSWPAYKSNGATGPEPVGFYSSNSDSKLTRYSGYFPAAGEKWWAQQVDTGAGGIHTGASPESVGVAVGSRRFVTVALSPAPSGVTGSDVYVGYGAATPGTTKYKRAEALTGRTMTLTDGKVTAGVQVARVISNKVLNANVATLTSNAHGFIVGETVVIAGVDATFNGTYVLTAVTTNTFSYAKVNANVASTAATGTASLTNTMGGAPAELYDTATLVITNKALTSNVATLTFAARHDFRVGDSVVVSGVDAVFDGTYVITATTATTISYAKINANVGSVAATGTVTGTYNRWKGDNTADLPGLKQTTPIMGTFVVEAGGIFVIGEQLLYRVGRVVHAYMAITRASGFSAATINCATIPDGFKPTTDKTQPTSVMGLPGTVVYYRFSVLAGGNKVRVGQSAALATSSMILHETWLTNDPYP